MGTNIMNVQRNQSPMSTWMGFTIDSDNIEWERQTIMQGGLFQTPKSIEWSARVETTMYC